MTIAIMASPMPLQQSPPVEPVEATSGPLTGKVAVVVGGGTGIGRGCAEALLAAGATVVVGGRRTGPLAELSNVDGQLHYATVDVADLDSTEAFFAAVEAGVGSPDIVVNSAGMNVSPRTLMDTSKDDWDRLLSVNAGGAFHVMRACVPAMVRRGDGLVVTISSIAGLRALELAGVGYCASKFATTALSTYAGLELAESGVRFTAIYPGEVETPILDQRPEPVSAERRAKMLQPEDVGAAVVMVASLPPRAHVPDLTIKPTVQRFA